MTSRSPATPDRSTSAMQRIAKEAGLAHISQPLAVELRRLILRLSRQVSGEEERAA
jgi:hypothetical protein